MISTYKKSKWLETRLDEIDTTEEYTIGISESTYAFTMLGHLDGKTGGCGSFSNTTFASDKDPAERVLLDQVLEGGREFRFVCLHHFLYFILQS